MGLIHANARMLLAAQRDGFAFDRVATIGRQQVFLSDQQLNDLNREFGRERPLGSHPMRHGEFCEPFLSELLDCREVESVDFSDFEGATIQHDMNQPIDDSLEQRFDAVIDGGSLEHIFNVPVAIANCMRMTKVGGSVMICSPANNHFGHGFYQFSPDFFFRVFQPGNGFRLCKVVLIEHAFPGVELSQDHRCYEVADPATARRRVGLVSPRPALMMVLAKRISDGPVLSSFPQQSDYQQRWQESAESSPSMSNESAVPTSFLKQIRRLGGDSLRAIRDRAPQSTRRWFSGRQQLRDYSLRNREFFRPWVP